MNIKLLTAVTLLLTAGSAIPVLSANDRDLSTLLKTRKCVDCNLSNIPNYIEKSLYRKDLRNANIRGANISRTSLSLSDLRNVDFSYTNSKSAAFDGADLRNADFSYADLSGANFCNADLRGVNWTKIIFNKDTKCLPDEAIDYVLKVSKKSDRTAHYCPEPKSNSGSSKKASTNNLDTVKEVTNTIEDIIKLF